MIESVMFWNEPNNLSHWDFELDKTGGSSLDGAAGRGRRAGREPAADAGARRHLADRPGFLETMQRHGVLDALDVVAVHGFPLDWNHWTIHEWPDKLAEVRARRRTPLWVSEVGVSTFGAEEVQDFGLRRTAELLIGRAERIHWYSLFDLPRAWPATTRHREAEGSSYYRHFYMGLLREDGTPKQAMQQFAELHAGAGHLPVVPLRGPPAGRWRSRWLQRLGVTHMRTGLSWAD